MPQSKLQQLYWLNGHWQGEALGGLAEEVWSPALGGSMMGSFKLLVEGQIKFYEFMTISEENDSLVLKIKHFNPDLKGWEKQDEYVEAKLIRLNDSKLMFQGFSFECISQNQIEVTVESKREDQTELLVFNYRRV